MLRSYLVWGLGLALGCGLLAGCVSRTPDRGAGVKAGTNEPATSVIVGDWRIGGMADAHAHYGAGVVADMNEDTEAALREFYKAATLDPGDAAMVLEVARRFEQNKQPEKAIELLKGAAARPDAPAAVFGRLGFLYSQSGKFEQAIAANRTAIRKAPDVLGGYQNLFLNYAQTKQPQAALTVLDEAAQRPGASAEFLLGLAELYTNFERQQPKQSAAAKGKALALLHRAEKLRPLAPALQMQLAEGFNTLGDLTKAAELYLELLKALPDLPALRERIHGRLTDIYLRSADRKRAVEQLKAIVRDNPTDPQAYYFLGSIAHEDKRYADAVEYFNKTILLKKDFEQAYYDLALAQLGLNKTGDALATLSLAREKFSQNFVLELVTALAFGAQKAYPEALQHFTAAEVVAKATDPKRLNDRFYFQVGATCERKGDLEEAEKYFEKCLQMAPNSADALNYLGYMWAEHGIKLDKARELIEKAIKLEPKNAAYLDSLGWVLFKQGQPKEALTYILKATELSDEPDATLFDHLGDIYAALKEPEKARAAWDKSFSLEANEQVKKKLDSTGGK